MIRTRQDLKHNLLLDKISEFRHGGMGEQSLLKSHLNPRLRFIRNLRYYEYYHNQKRNIYGCD